MGKQNKKNEMIVDVLCFMAMFAAFIFLIIVAILVPWLAGVLLLIALVGLVSYVLTHDEGEDDDNT